MTHLCVRPNAQKPQAEPSRRSEMSMRVPLCKKVFWLFALAPVAQHSRLLSRPESSLEANLRRWRINNRCLSRVLHRVYSAGGCRGALRARTQKQVSRLSSCPDIASSKHHIQDNGRRLVLFTLFSHRVSTVLAPTNSAQPVETFYGTGVPDLPHNAVRRMA